MQVRKVPKEETAKIFQTEAIQAGGSEAPSAVGNVKDAVLKFTKVEDYTTFLVEYAFTEDHIIVHFFPPAEAYEVSPAGDSGRVKFEFLRWWRGTFPNVLSPAAEKYFKATYPVLQAQYVPEMTSWWMRCAGFASRLDPDGYISKFFEVLDETLDPKAT